VVITVGKQRWSPSSNEAEAACQAAVEDVLDSRHAKPQPSFDDIDVSNDNPDFEVTGTVGYTDAAGSTQSSPFRCTVHRARGADEPEVTAVHVNWGAGFDFSVR
jgi:hypothetical protein